MEIPHGGVAFFDSGIGGLTVFAECRKRIPWGDFYYFGDNARAPYGNLEEERIFSYVEEAFALFVSNVCARNIPFLLLVQNLPFYLRQNWGERC